MNTRMEVMAATKIAMASARSAKSTSCALIGPSSATTKICGLWATPLTSGLLLTGPIGDEAPPAMRAALDALQGPVSYALSVARERFLRIQNDAFGAQLDYFVALAALERVVGIDLWNDVHDHIAP